MYKLYEFAMPLTAKVMSVKNKENSSVNFLAHLAPPARPARFW